MSKVQQEDTVQVHYTGTLSSGEVFDSSREREEPLEFTVGQKQLIPGFENGILDMEVNETKTINIPAAEAYGERRDDLIQEVPKSELPPELEPEVGMPLSTQTAEGQQLRLVVTEVKDESIVVDANHPLAGQDLTFDVELVAIK